MGSVSETLPKSPRYPRCIDVHSAFRAVHPTREKKCIHPDRLHRLQPLQPSPAFLDSRSRSAALSRPRTTLMHLRVNAVTTVPAAAVAVAVAVAPTSRGQGRLLRGQATNTDIPFISFLLFLYLIYFSLSFF